MRLQISDSAARFAFAVPSALSNLSAVFCELDIVHRIVCVGNRKESEGYPIISDLALSSATCSSGFPETCPDEDIVFLPYSSGTSGPRKGVAISHYALNAMLKIFNKSV
uniref:AMP-binding domain-containing protein n=1 Tax=Ascaris lumbricoides TaxID=6252 RepID=A0A0M3HL58_ASCLU